MNLLNFTPLVKIDSNSTETDSGTKEESKEQDDERMIEDEEPTLPIEAVVTVPTTTTTTTTTTKSVPKSQSHSSPLSEDKTDDEKTIEMSFSLETNLPSSTTTNSNNNSQNKSSLDILDFLQNNHSNDDGHSNDNTEEDYFDLQSSSSSINNSKITKSLSLNDIFEVPITTQPTTSNKSKKQTTLSPGRIWQRPIPVGWSLEKRLSKNKSNTSYYWHAPQGVTFNSYTSAKRHWEKRGQVPLTEAPLIWEGNNNSQDADGETRKTKVVLRMEEDKENKGSKEDKENKDDEVDKSDKEEETTQEDSQTLKSLQTPRNEIQLQSSQQWSEQQSSEKQPSEVQGQRFTK